MKGRKLRRGFWDYLVAVEENKEKASRAGPLLVDLPAECQEAKMEFLVTRYEQGVATDPPDVAVAVARRAARRALAVFVYEGAWPALDVDPPACKYQWPRRVLDVRAGAVRRPTEPAWAEAVCAFGRAVYYYDTGDEGCERCWEGMQWLLSGVENLDPPNFNAAVGRDRSMWCLVHYTAALGSPAQLRSLLSCGDVAALLTCKCGLGSVLQVAGFALGQDGGVGRFGNPHPPMALR